MNRLNRAWGHELLFIYHCCSWQTQGLGAWTFFHISLLFMNRLRAWWCKLFFIYLCCSWKDSGPGRHELLFIYLCCSWKDSGPGRHELLFIYHCCSWTDSGPLLFIYHEQTQGQGAWTTFHMSLLFMNRLGDWGHKLLFIYHCSSRTDYIGPGGMNYF